MAKGSQFHLITGHVGQAPDAKFTAQGKAITNFSVAVQDGREHTEWFRVVAFDKQADIVREYVNKGDLIQVEGRFHTKEGTDGKRYTDLIANSITLLTSKPKAAEVDI